MRLYLKPRILFACIEPDIAAFSKWYFVDSKSG